MTLRPKKPNVFRVEETSQTFDYWLNRPYISGDLKQHLRAANVLLVPREGYLDNAVPLFPNTTEEIFSFLKEHSNQGIATDICIADEDYQELTLHDALVVLGTFVVTSLVAPLFVNLVAEYIKKKWQRREDTTRIKVEMIVVEQNGDAKKFLYEGSAADFKGVAGGLGSERRDT
jgi:hypothetical protein